jgi:hypothetical protein
MNDISVLEQYHEYEGPDLCELCASDSAYFVFEKANDNEGKYHCLNCGGEYKFTGTEYRDTGDLCILKGEKRKWFEYLKEVLTFPFEGYIHEFQDRGPFKQGDSVIVKKIEYEDDDYGIIAAIDLQGTKRSGKYSIPIADVSAKDEKSQNYKELHDYSVWIANF